ncbi:hypothetical protein NIES4103_66090 [Nostoc sp. NIES-4103]|nr:hypothetical protein NIES4103_66090 [Nostoc sp. NIES-4103]
MQHSMIELIRVGAPETAALKTTNHRHSFTLEPHTQPQQTQANTAPLLRPQENSPLARHRSRMAHRRQRKNYPHEGLSQL